MPEKHNWGVTIKDTLHSYDGLPWDMGIYVGEGRSLSELIREPYLRERVKVI